MLLLLEEHDEALIEVLNEVKEHFGIDQDEALEKMLSTSRSWYRDMKNGKKKIREDDTSDEDDTY